MVYINNFGIVIYVNIEIIQYLQLKNFSCTAWLKA